MKVLKFHQFIRIEKGPINSVVIDFLKGNVFQVSNEDIEKFENGDYKAIPDFMDMVKSEQLVIEIDKSRWIPRSDFEIEKDNDKEIDKPTKIVTLEIEEGVDMNSLSACFSNLPVEKRSGDRPGQTLRLSRSFFGHEVFLIERI